MSIFTMQYPTGIFAPCSDVNPYVAVTFERPTQSQNSAMEIVTSVVVIGPVTGSLQPVRGRFQRHLHGQVIQVDYDFIVLGTPDLREGDRATLSGILVEIISTNQYGKDHCEIALKELR